MPSKKQFHKGNSRRLHVPPKIQRHATVDSMKPNRRKKRTQQADDIFKPVAITRESLTNQSGDLNGLPSIPVADSQSVEELAEEGQDFEAEVVLGIQDAVEAEAEDSDDET